MTRLSKPLRPLGLIAIAGWTVAIPVVGCQFPTVDGVECSAYQSSFSSIVSQYQASSGVCSQDSDCTLATPDVTCDGGAPLESACPVGLTPAVIAAMQNTLSQLAAQQCPAACGSTAAPSCTSVRAVCAKGACATAVP